jgi:hypothetical protein
MHLFFFLYHTAPCFSWIRSPDIALSTGSRQNFNEIF